MYKYLIVGVALMFFTSGAYYLQGAGGGAIVDAIAGKDITQENFMPVNQENIPGTYSCKTISTCKHPYTLTLRNDGSVELSSDRSKNTPETGTWNLDVQNILVITLDLQENSSYPTPQKIVIKDVKTKTLSKISYTRSNYPDMTNPIFIREE